MATLADIRAQYPQYQDMSDDALADALHSKFYSDVPREQFNQKLGLKAPEQPVAEGDYPALAARIGQAGAAIPQGQMGPITADQTDAQRLAEAKHQGQIYGQSRPAGETGYRSFQNSLLLGGPQLLEAALPSYLGGQDSLPTSEAHEFIKSADNARASVNPKSALGGSIAGAVPQVLIPGTGAPTVAARIARAGLLGGGLGLTEGAISSRGDSGETAEGAAKGLALGLGGGAAAEGIASAAGKVAGAFNKRPVAPTADDLTRLSSEAYKRAEDAGVMFSPQATSKLRDDIQSAFADRAFHPALQPNAGVVFNELDRVAGQPATLSGLDTTRKMAGGAFIPGNDSNNALLNIVKGKIDNLVQSPATGDVLGGDAAGAAASLKEARDFYSRMKKSDLVDEALGRAERRAGSTGSGGNVDNASRQNIRGILDSPKKSRGFTPDELAQMETVVRGTPVQNALRMAGKLSPHGNGLMLAGGLGAAAAAGPIGLIPSAIGLGAKHVADRMTQRNIGLLDELIRAGGNRASITPSPNMAQRLVAGQKRGLLGATIASELYPQRRQ